MEKRHRDILRENHLFLVENLDFKSVDFHAKLFGNSLISEDDLERIQAKVTLRAMASEFLLHILPRRGPEAFGKFVRTLRSADMEFIAEQLDPNNEFV